MGGLQNLSALAPNIRLRWPWQRGSSSDRKVTESRLPLVACQCVLELDIEPQIAPDEQLAPCMAASFISALRCHLTGKAL